MAKTTSAERNKAYRARHRNNPAFRERERARVRAWRDERRAAGLPITNVRTLGVIPARPYAKQHQVKPGPLPQQYAPPRFREMWEGDE